MMERENDPSYQPHQKESKHLNLYNQQSVRRKLSKVGMSQENVKIGVLVLDPVFSLHTIDGRKMSASHNLYQE
jgi:hypothetical protein